MSECTLDTFINHNPFPKFGDFILFQEYGEKYVSKPIFVIFIGTEVWDQAVGFYYLKWTKEPMKFGQFIDPVKSIRSHVEWDEVINILGHWDHRPNFKELLFAYRKYEKRSVVPSEEIWISDEEYKRRKRENKLNRII